MADHDTKKLLDACKGKGSVQPRDEAPGGRRSATCYSTTSTHHRVGAVRTEPPGR